MTPSNKDIIKCGFLECAHACNRPASEYPPLGTPIEKIIFVSGDRSRAMYCTGCHRFTIYVSRPEEADRLREKYKSKQP